MAISVRDVKAEIENKFKSHIIRNIAPGSTNFRYAWKDVKWELVNFKVDPISATTTDPSAFMTGNWNNCSTETQQETWSNSKTNAETFTISFREGLQLGMDVEVKEDILIESSKVKFSAKLDLSSTQTQSSTVSQTMSVNEVIKIPACKSIEATAFIYKGKFSTDFQASVKATGRFGFSYDDPLEKGNPSHGNPADFTIEEFLKDNKIKNQFDAKGKLSGVVGLRLDTVTQAHDPVDCGEDSGCVEVNTIPPRA